MVVTSSFMCVKMSTSYAPSSQRNAGEEDAGPNWESVWRLAPSLDLLRYSPADLHCMWFPPVSRTLLPLQALSGETNLHRIVSGLFQIKDCIMHDSNPVVKLTFFVRKYYFLKDIL